jgi:hypothetical protein
MAIGFPTKANWAAGDVLTASAMDDLAGTVNLLSPVGVTSGYALTANGTSNSYTWTAMSTGSPYVAGKNFVIGGGFDIWQRGTTFTNPTTSAGAYAADRWQSLRGSSWTTGITTTRQSAGLTGFNYNIRCQRTAGNTATAYLALGQSLETVNTIPLAGQTVTLSFYARKGSDYSSASSILNASIYAGTGTDENGVTNSYTGQTQPLNQNVTLTTSWQRFSYSFSYASTVTETAIYFNYTPVGTAGTNDYFEVTGVQLEIGSTASTFSRAGGNIQGELAACQRYYWRSTPNAAYGQQGTVGTAKSTSIVKAVIPFPVQMRVIPTSMDYSTLAVNDGLNIITVTSAATSGYETQLVAFPEFTVGGTPLIQYRPYGVNNNGSTSGYLGFSAEL